MEVQERVAVLRKEVEESQKSVEMIEQHGAFVEMKLAQLENKQKSDMLFFQDQFNLKLQKSRDRPLSQQDQFQLQSFFGEAQGVWEKKIANLGTILHKKARQAQKTQSDQVTHLSRAIQEYLSHFQQTFQQTQETFLAQLSQAKALLASKADRGCFGDTLATQKDKLQFLHRSVEMDFQEQRKKIQVVDSLVLQNQSTPLSGLAQQQQAVGELQKGLSQMGRQIQQELQSSGLQEEREDRGVREEEKIREVERRRSQVEQKVQEVQRQLVLLNERVRQSQERAEDMLQTRVIHPLSQLQRDYEYARE